MAHKLNNGDNYEHVCNVVLTKDKYPITFEKKVQELLEEGRATSREEAEKMISEMEIELEIYYKKGYGLFAVESGCVRPTQKKNIPIKNK